MKFLLPGIKLYYRLWYRNNGAELSIIIFVLEKMKNESFFKKI